MPLADGGAGAGAGAEEGVDATGPTGGAGGAAGGGLPPQATEARRSGERDASVRAFTREYLSRGTRAARRPGGEASPALVTCVRRIVKGLDPNAQSVLGFASRPPPGSNLPSVPAHEGRYLQVLQLGMHLSGSRRQFQPSLVHVPHRPTEMLRGAQHLRRAGRGRRRLVRELARQVVAEWATVKGALDVQLVSLQVEVAFERWRVSAVQEESELPR